MRFASTRCPLSATPATRARKTEPTFGGSGGGLALLRCIDAVAAVERITEGDERTGVQCLKRALESPARQIAENSAVDGGVVVHRMIESTGAQGFDAARGEYVDLFEAGIVDPTKVVRCALQNAASIAGLMLTTSTMVTSIKDDQKAVEGSTS